MSILKPDLKEYGFELIEEYFQYIIDSIINGQFTQARSLIQALSRKQKKELLLWLVQNKELDEQQYGVFLMTVEYI